MKTLLGLVMVLGLVSMASATVELYIGEVNHHQYNPAPNEIRLVASDILILGIGSPTTEFGATYFLGITLNSPGQFLTNASGANVIRESALLTNAPGFVGYYGIADAADYGYNELVCFDTAVPGLTPNGAGFWIGIPFHENNNDRGQTIRLLADDLTVLDTLVIPASPEPATLALLALGGVALMRKRRG